MSNWDLPHMTEKQLQHEYLLLRQRVRNYQATYDDVERLKIVEHYLELFRTAHRSERG